MASSINNCDCTGSFKRCGDYDNVKFTDLFDIKEIQAIQDAFANATGVASIITTVDGEPITKPSNFCHLCLNIIRNTPKGLENCKYSDAQLGRLHPDGSIVQKCLSGGLWDGGSSICVGERHIANWLIGQVRDESMNLEAMRIYAREIGADEEEFLKALQDVPQMSLTQFEKVSRMLFLFARKLSELALKNWQQEQMIEQIQKAQNKLTESNVLLEKKVEERTEQLTAMNEELIAMNQELQDSNRALGLQNEKLQQEISFREKVQKELADSLVKLQRTQEQLIQQDKLAALGNLVAGIAHEINTPVGIALTAASYLEEEGRKMHSTYESGQLRRQDLNDFNHEFTESIELMLSNLKRAAELIRSVKQLTIDQVSEDKREFFLGNYLQQVINTILPSIKSKNLKVSVDCPSDIKIISYPGLISQIITNLVMNSVHHAFDNRVEGKIQIEVSNTRLTADQISIYYKDDGKGIAPEIQHRIFEPFYTTKRGQGGSGLGLYIVYNLVQKLNGKIECHSEVDQGTTFMIDIPI